VHVRLAHAFVRSLAPRALRDDMALSTGYWAKLARGTLDCRTGLRQSPITTQDSTPWKFPALSPHSEGKRGFWIH
jgi:hypothetical protein